MLPISAPCHELTQPTSTPLFSPYPQLAIGLAESWRVAVGWATPVGNGFNSLKDDYELGNLLFDPLNLRPDNDEEWKVMQTKELNNGESARQIGWAEEAISEMRETVGTPDGLAEGAGEAGSGGNTGQA